MIILSVGAARRLEAKGAQELALVAVDHDRRVEVATKELQDAAVHGPHRVEIRPPDGVGRVVGEGEDADQKLVDRFELNEKVAARLCKRIVLFLPDLNEDPELLVVDQRSQFGLRAIPKTGRWQQAREPGGSSWPPPGAYPLAPTR